MTNRFKGLDLVERQPTKLWTEVSNTLQESVTKIISKKKKFKKAKWLSEEALQIAEEISKKQQRKGKVHPTERTVSKITSSCSVNNAKK